MISTDKELSEKILLVEDEPDVAQLFRNWLTHQHHEVDVVGNGTKALIHLTVNKHKYEVIILDTMLPGKAVLRFASSIVINPVQLLY